MKYPMIDIAMHTSRQSIREYIVALGLKNKKEAKAYYFLHLVCALIEHFGKETFSGGGSDLN